MRLRIAIIAAKIILLVSGISLLVVGLFAFQLSLDNDAGWGTGRKIVVVVGLISCLGFIILHFYREIRQINHAIIDKAGSIGRLLLDTSIGRYVQQIGSRFSSRIRSNPLQKKSICYSWKTNDYFPGLVLSSVH